MTDRLNRLAELSIHGANVQDRAIVLVSAEICLEEPARAAAVPAWSPAKISSEGAASE